MTSFNTTGKSSVAGNLGSANHLEEFSYPLFQGGNSAAEVLTPAERKALVQYNLGLTTSSTPEDSGTVTTSATTSAAEAILGGLHTTTLTCTDFAVGTGADTADLAIGASLYTFPAGVIAIEGASLSGAFTYDADVNTIADGEYGMGTVIGSTAVDTLGEVGATSENIIEGTAITTYVADGTSLVARTDNRGLGILTAGVHVAFINFAATFPNSATGTLALTFTGTVVLRWRRVSA